jgi:hypothetical protein
LNVGIQGLEFRIELVMKLHFPGHDIRSKLYVVKAIIASTPQPADARA